MKVSFARQVKEEVVFNDFDICCQKAILSAIIKVNGTLSLSNQGLLLTIRTENAKIASKVHKMLKEVYHPHIEFLVSRKMKLQKNNIYILKVSKAREILDDLGLMNGLGFHTLPDKKIIQKECCKRAFLAGIFLSGGSVNNPETSNYHLELSVDEEEYALFIQELMNYFNLNAKMTKRRNKYLVYLNRWNNCDIANEVKSMASSNKQLEDISIIEMFMGLDMLDEKTRTVALIRKKYPDYTLNELCNAYQDETGLTISKSGLHHRFKKLSEQAAQLMQMQNE